MSSTHEWLGPHSGYNPSYRCCRGSGMRREPAVLFLGEVVGNHSASCLRFSSVLLFGCLGREATLTSLLVRLQTELWLDA